MRQRSAELTTELKDLLMYATAADDDAAAAGHERGRRRRDRGRHHGGGSGSASPRHAARTRASRHPRQVLRPRDTLPEGLG